MGMALKLFLAASLCVCAALPAAPDHQGVFYSVLIKDGKTALCLEGKNKDIVSHLVAGDISVNISSLQPYIQPTFTPPFKWGPLESKTNCTDRMGGEMDYAFSFVVEPWPIVSKAVATGVKPGPVPQGQNV